MHSVNTMQFNDSTPVTLNRFESMWVMFVHMSPCALLRLHVSLLSSLMRVKLSSC